MDPDACVHALRTMLYPPQRESENPTSSVFEEDPEECEKADNDSDREEEMHDDFIHMPPPDPRVPDNIPVQAVLRSSVDPVGAPRIPVHVPGGHVSRMKNPLPFAELPPQQLGEDAVDYMRHFDVYMKIQQVYIQPM